MLPEPQDWRTGYGVVDPNGKEVLSYTFWERQAYVSGTTVELEFFAAQRSGIAGNLSLAGQLPSNNAFLIQAIRIHPAVRPTERALAAPATGQQESALDDVWQLIHEGHARLTVGDKQYGRWPIFMLPGGGGVTGQLAVPGVGTADTTAQYAAATNGPTDPRAVYSLPVPVVVPPQYNYRVICEWPTAITFLGTSAIVPQIYVMLDGQLMRPKQ